MSGIQPVAVYAMRIPPGDIMVPAVPEFAAMFRVTMAAIDPSAEPELEDADDQRPPRATLKVIRLPDDDDDESDDEDYLDDDDEEDSDEENGGPSDKQLKKQILLEALAADEDEDEDMEDDDDDEDDEIAAAAKAIKKLTQTSKFKGKGKALDDEDDSEEDDDESEEDLGIDEVVLCTLDPERHYNQPLDFVVNEGEKIFFKVSGTHTVHLTGNFVMPIDDGQASLYDDEDEEDDYDLSPDEDELDLLEDEEEESDELDDIADPRITEVASDEEEAPKLVATKKGKNKRSAADLDAEEDLDALVAKSIKKDEAPVNGESKKLSKAEKKAAKKLKKNDGEAVAAGTLEKKTEATVNGSEKKTVQFAKNLEQGPTPSAAPPAKKDNPKKEENKATNNSTSLGVRDVNGVTVDDRKMGSGPAAKKNSKVEMRYIGKLENGKVFDSNKSGKPFSFKLGTGEVIKGWNVGLEGISAGGERRITIPANLAYGNKQLPGIPKNSKLIFDVKCLSVK